MSRRLGVPTLVVVGVLLAGVFGEARATESTASGAVVAPGARDAEVRGAVAQVLADCRSGDAQAVAAHLDLVRLAREVARANVLGDVDIAHRSAFEATVAIAVRNAVLSDAAVVSTGDAEIRNVVLDASGSEAQVFLRQRDAAGYRYWSRWWLACRNDHWLIHDVADIDSGIRLSLATAALVAAESEAGTDVGVTARVVLELRAATSALATGDVLAARERLDDVPDGRLPRVLEGLRGIVRASVALASGLPRRALAALDAVPTGGSAAGDPPPITHLLRALSHAALQEHEAALAAARAYVAAVGGDADGWTVVGDALVRLERRDEAREAYRVALEDDPAAVNALAGLLALLDARVPAESAEIARALAAAGDLGELLDGLGFALLDRDAVDRVEDVVSAAAGGGRDLRVRSLLLLARARAAAGRPGDGAVIVSALADDLVEGDPELYAEVLHATLDLRRDADGAVAALVESPDPFLAFPYLADQLVGEGRADELERLVAVHAEREPEDPSLLRYGGHVFRLRGDNARATHAFLTALAAADDWDSRSALHALALGCGYRAGRGLSLIDELAPRRMTVERLANQAFTARDAPFLLSLAERQQRDDPSDPGLPLWRAAAAYAAGDDAAVVAGLASLDRSLDGVGLTSLADDLLVRSLFRVGDRAGALDAAHRSADRDGDPIHVAVVYALSGDVERTGAALATLAAIGYRPADLAADADLGPALKSPAFAELAARFGPRADARDD